MSVQAINIPKNPTKLRNSNSQNTQNKEFQGNFANTNSVLSNKKKIGIFTTTLLGVGAVMAATLKKKGYSLKIKDIINTAKRDYKKLGLLDITYDSKKHEVETLVTKLALGSVGGGLLGGILFDKKENYNAKIRESIIQLVGNIFTPLACVAVGMRTFKKYGDKIPETHRLLKIPTKGAANLLASGICLATGILLGNKVGNLINQSVFHSKEERKIKLSDMSPHIDDVCVATSLIAAESQIGPYISRIIPAALMVAGVSTGFAQECPENCPKPKAK